MEIFQEETNLLVSLEKLLLDLKQRSESFDEMAAKHKQYLPQEKESVMPIKGLEESSGDHEQVIEVQQERTVEVAEVLEDQTPPSDIPSSKNNKHIFMKFKEIGKPSVKTSFWENSLISANPKSTAIDPSIYLSPEAEKILGRLPRVNGEPIFYLAAKNDSIYVICNMDYHSLMVPKSYPHNDEFGGTIFTPSKLGPQVIYGPNTPLSSSMEDKMLFARFYIGDINFSKEETARFIQIFKALPKPQSDAIINWGKTKGSSSVRKWIKETLSV